MKRFFSIYLAALLAVLPSHAQVCEHKGIADWHADKYSMFIHFGLYSYYGGCWDDEPVTRGYSEQIQSHAGIFSDWYASAAGNFDPVKFDAAQIASLARKSGMRSIVFTSKHHDGFCMFNTATTGYSSVSMTPSGRDYVRELSEACAAEGLSFGLYFSLIDWNFPHAYPISSHNADFITPEHHRLNMAQVKELVSGYGRISELWFDMGSLLPEQSRELYELVKEHQPDCMVSGRLGNDVYDFAVMPDNTYPDGALQAPWQTAASMFNETWSWRSWQERGKVEDKVAEKLRSLINVVSHGGNFLLNIGPDKDGAVIPFEHEVLESIGEWLSVNGEAVYGTEASPFRTDFPWGAVTRKDNRLYLILSGEAPSDGVISLDMQGYRLKKCETPGVEVLTKKGVVRVRVPEQMYADRTDVKVVCLEFDRQIAPSGYGRVIPQGEYATVDDALASFSYSCFDYYSNYRSTVSYGWTLDSGKGDKVWLYHTEDERGRKVCAQAQGSTVSFVLEGIPAEMDMADCNMLSTRYMRLRGGTFNGPSQWKVFSGQELDEMKVLDEGGYHGGITPFSNHLIVAEIEVSKAGFALFDVCGGNGVELVVDGNTFMKHLNPYRTVSRTERVMLYLDEGRHQLVLRAYNRFEDSLNAYLSPASGKVYKTELPMDLPGTCHLKLSSEDVVSVHSDCGLHNIVIKVD